MDAERIYNKLKGLQKDKGYSNRRLCEMAGVSHTVLDNWRNRKSIPGVEILEGFSNVLGVSVSQLLENGNYEDLTADEQELLTLWSTLSAEDKRVLKELMHYLRSKNGPSPDKK